MSAAEGHLDCTACLKGMKGDVHSITICGHPLAKHFKRMVSSAICSQCPLKTLDPNFDRNQFEWTDPTQPPTFLLPVVEGELVTYPKTGWEPPPDIPGYRRKSDDWKSPDAWTFISEWPKCGLREINAKRKVSCGCVTVGMICRQPRSPHSGRRVELATCQGCTVRG